MEIATTTVPKTARSKYVLSSGLPSRRSALARRTAQTSGHPIVVLRFTTPPQVMCVRERVAESGAEASLEQIDESIESIANQIRVLDEIIHSGRLIKRRGEKVVSSGEKLRETLEREVGALQEHMKMLRKERA